MRDWWATYCLRFDASQIMGPTITPDEWEFFTQACNDMFGAVCMEDFRSTVRNMQNIYQQEVLGGSIPERMIEAAEKNFVDFEEITPTTSKIIYDAINIERKIDVVNVTFAKEKLRLEKASIHTNNTNRRCNRVISDFG